MAVNNIKNSVESEAKRFTFVFDTSSIVKEGAFNLWLEQARGHLGKGSMVIPNAVFEELKAIGKENLITELLEDGTAYVTDEKFARTDDAVLFNAITLRRRARIMVITQDQHLASDIFGMNFAVNRIFVKRLGSMGNTQNFDPDTSPFGGKDQTTVGKLLKKLGQ